MKLNIPKKESVIAEESVEDSPNTAVTRKNPGSMTNPKSSSQDPKSPELRPTKKHEPSEPKFDTMPEINTSSPNANVGPETLKVDNIEIENMGEIP